MKTIAQVALKWAILCLLFATVACSHVGVTPSHAKTAPTNAPPPEPERIAIGKWHNLYKGDPKLAGVELSQCLREGNAYRDDSDYYGKHPAEVAYHFWNGRIRWITYYPDGKKMGDQWMEHGDIAQFSGRTDAKGYSLLKDLRRVELGNYISSWGSVDFSLGSDPQFKRHKDPRRVLDDAVQAYEKRLKACDPLKPQEVEQDVPSDGHKPSNSAPSSATTAPADAH